MYVVRRSMTGRVEDENTKMKGRRGEEGKLIGMVKKGCQERGKAKNERKKEKERRGERGKENRERKVRGNGLPVMRVLGLEEV